MTKTYRALLRFAMSLAALASSVAQAQPHLVKEINPNAITYGFSSAPRLLTNVNGTLLFTANDGTNGCELWKSDGTAAGTVRVKDINPGARSSFLCDTGSDAAPISINGTLFFGAGDGTSGYELWKSDGTEAGTVRVKDIGPGSQGTLLYGLTNVNGTLFFAAYQFATGVELWKSDGTEAGTVLVSEIRPGESGGFYAGQVTPPVNVNGTLFFTADDGTTGKELWKSDGTAAGTVRVKDIWPGESSSSPTYLTSFNGALFFSATDSTGGRELWKSDGTEAGTVRVKDIYSGVEGSSAMFLIDFNGTLFFWAAETPSSPPSSPFTFPPIGESRLRLWKSDGTEAGTVKVSEKARWNGLDAPSSEMTIVNGMLFFTAEDSTSKVELWRTDGTDAGTVRLTTMGAVSNCWGCSGYLMKPYALTNLNGTLFFGGIDTRSLTFPPRGELWKSDGTEAGTVLVKDILPGAVGSDPRELTAVNGTLFFNACDGLDTWAERTANCELWKSSGTEAGTVLVKDIYPGSGAHPEGSTPRSLTTVGGTLFFGAYDGTNPGLWKSDGTEAGTVLVKNTNVSCNGGSWGSCVDVGGTLFFGGSASANGPFKLWKSDGTEAGTIQVKDINPDLASLTNVGGTLFFTADDGTSGKELWKSDGTEAGTVRVKDIYPGPGTSSPNYLTNVNGTLFFGANDGTSGLEVWKSDGTEAGTVRVKDIYPGPNASLTYQSFVSFNGMLFFGADDGTTGKELWKSDGTESGTVRVKDIFPSTQSSIPRYSTVVDGKLFFMAAGLPGGVLGLYRSDGTEAGTVLIMPFCCDPDGPQQLTNVNGTLFFYRYATYSSPENERGLWKSDGTPSGTVLVKRLPDQYSAPFNLTNVNGTLYFGLPIDGGPWSELWKSDGSEAGTVRVAEIGVKSLTFMGSRLLFAGFQLNEHGVLDNGELWGLDFLTVLRDGDGCGVVTSTPLGIDCGSRCSASYDSGPLVDLTATPALNSLFAGWSGACSGSASCPVSTNAPQIATATFSRLPNASNDGDLDGIPDSLEAAEGKSRCAKDNDIFASARLFAMQQYRDFLGREGDAGGVAAWVSSIGGGTSRGVATKSFFDSAEFQGAIAPVARLYFAYFNRIPDKAGLDYWIGNYRAGMSLNTISQAFAGSPEFTATYGSLSNSDFVSLIYQNVLGRAPDAFGLAYWTDQLDRGLMTRGQVMTGFSESPEYQDRSYNRVFVTMIYYGMLRRVPDQGGFDVWVANLDAGVPTLNLIDGFLGTPEYHVRFLP